MTNHDHDYYYDDCMLCQDEKQEANSFKEDMLEFKRRAAVLSIPEDDIIDILNGTDFDIPDSGIITGVFHNIMKGTFELRICDKSFSIIPLNGHLPSLGSYTTGTQ